MRSAFETAHRTAWFPGHMAKTLRLMQETHIKTAHLIVEVRDARIPLSSANPELSRIINNKHRIVVLNKADLLPNREKECVRRYVQEATDSPVVFTHANAKSIKATNGVELIQEMQEYLPNRFKTTPKVALICGMPNVGKSKCYKHTSLNEQAILSMF